MENSGFYAVERDLSCDPFLLTNTLSFALLHWFMANAEWRSGRRTKWGKRPYIMQLGEYQFSAVKLAEQFKTDRRNLTRSIKFLVENGYIEKVGHNSSGTLIRILNIAVDEKGRVKYQNLPNSKIPTKPWAPVDTADDKPVDCPTRDTTRDTTRPPERLIPKGSPIPNHKPLTINNNSSENSESQDKPAKKRKTTRKAIEVSDEDKELASQWLIYAQESTKNKKETLDTIAKDLAKIRAYREISKIEMKAIFHFMVDDDFWNPGECTPRMLNRKNKHGEWRVHFLKKKAADYINVFSTPKPKLLKASKEKKNVSKRSIYKEFMESLKNDEDNKPSNEECPSGSRESDTRSHSH